MGAIRKKLTNAAVLLFSVIFLITGCGGGSDDKPNNAAPVLGELVSISVTADSDNIIEGLDIQFTAKGSYSGGRTIDITESVVWSSDDENIAIVDGDGLVEGIASGDVVITAAWVIVRF